MSTKHWLHGEVELPCPVEKDMECKKCIHNVVCKRTMQEFCLNYTFATSTEAPSSCLSCIHHYTRFDQKQPISCFACKHYRNE